MTTIRSTAFILASTLLVTAFSAPVHAGISGFGDFSLWTINQSDAASPPLINIPGNAIQLTTNASGELRSVFYNTPQSIDSFDMSFTLQMTNGGLPRAAFVLQNAAAGSHAIGGTFGYSGIPNSLAISFEPTNLSGVYSGGSVGGGATSISPIDFSSNHAINVNFSYHGHILHESLVDSVTAAHFSTDYVLNIPLIIGGSSAYVGFSTNDSTGSSVEIFAKPNMVPEPASGILLTIGGMVAFIGWRRRALRSNADGFRCAVTNASASDSGASRHTY